MISGLTGSTPTRAVLIATFSLAALVMVYMSHVLPRCLPGDFVTAMYAGSNVTLTQDQERELADYYRSDESFGSYLERLVRLEWGYSYVFLRPVSELVLEALPWTLLLVGGAQVLSLIIGFVSGVEAAWRRGRPVEKAMVGVMTLLEGIPEISTGVILLVVFALKLQWFPAAGAETAYAEASTAERIMDMGRHLTIPLVTLVLAYTPGAFLITRNSMIMVIKEPFVDTARAKGLTAARINYGHAARNALLPVVTRVAMRLAFMVTGALVVETLFSYPGLGTLLYNAVGSRDVPLIRAVVLLSALMVLGINLALELIYRAVDPRIEHV